MRRIRGWTLIEVVVAMLTLSIAATAVAASLSYAYRVRNTALKGAFATVVAESWLEKWRAGPWTGAQTGRHSFDVKGYPATVEWSVSTQGVCVEEAVVTARVGAPAAVRTTVSTRRFRERWATC